MKATTPSLGLMARLIWAGVPLDEAMFIVERRYPIKGGLAVNDDRQIAHRVEQYLWLEPFWSDEDGLVWVRSEDPREYEEYDAPHLREQDWLDWLRCDREEDKLTRAVGEFGAWVTQTFWNPVMYEGDPA